MRPTRIVITVAIAALAVAGIVRYGLVRGPAPHSTGEIVIDSNATGTNVETEAYANALNAYVDDKGMVNYAGLQANPDDLNRFLTSAANLDPEAFAAWSDAERIAFWCNVYNAYTLKAIINHYPIRASFIGGLRHPKNSIRQIPGVWDTMTWPVMGKELTLDNIEHDTLRVEFDEPRIHAALVCAAMSCPPLRNEPYDGARLDEQLDDQMVQYLADPDRFRIDRGSNTVYLSSILKWYGEDFVKSYAVDDAFQEHGEVERAVLNAIAPYVGEDDAAYLRSAAFAIEYLDYDWSLNEQ